MKHRLIDLLRCSCGSSDLQIEGAVAERVPFAGTLTNVRCRERCSFRRAAVGDGSVTPSDCMECFGQEIVGGTIRCRCGRGWPIMQGIPRFLPDHMATDFEKTQETFSYEWRMFRFGERNWGQDIEHRKELFVKAMGADPERLRGKLILDAGCGSGLLSMEMAKSFGMEVVALDLSFGVEKAYANNKSPYVHFLQGSVLDLPLQDGVVDYLYCAGVLVHLPDTEAGFRAIAPVAKPGGRCFVWVYHPITSQFHSRDLTKMRIYGWIRRAITARLPIRIQYALYLSMMPAFLAKQWLKEMLGVQTDRRTWREKMQALFDFFSPVYQNRHTPEEVMRWYAEQGFAEVEVAYRGRWGFGVRGTATGETFRDRIAIEGH
jgi:ubiquinone/menaquinone biosynthesis C-methylase UbiE/uncharacterized protein YbaR (Trm112 family)